MKLKPILNGITTFLPGMRYRMKGTGGHTDSARYCYSVWLRHLVKAKENGLDPHPGVVAELGPGSSLGTGLAALLSGAKHYFAFDLVKLANTDRNLAVFNELVALFENRENIPDESEFPGIRPYLSSYEFPAEILDENTLQRALQQDRVKQIRDAIQHPFQENSPIEYKAPWFDVDVLKNESVDMIFSQAVLEHVDDLTDTYRVMHLWLKPSGYISHTIDFKCHGTADEWNGHWAYSDFVWRLVRGRNVYLLNRAPHSTHISILQDKNFKVVCDIKFNSASHLRTSDLAPRFRSISHEDLTTSAAFVQAVKS